MQDEVGTYADNELLAIEEEESGAETGNYKRKPFVDSFCSRRQDLLQRDLNPYEMTQFDSSEANLMM